jgi:hypothetical protein
MNVNPRRAPAVWIALWGVWACGSSRRIDLAAVPETGQVYLQFAAPREIRGTSVDGDSLFLEARAVYGVVRRIRGDTLDLQLLAVRQLSGWLPARNQYRRATVMVVSTPSDVVELSQPANVKSLGLWVGVLAAIIGTIYLVALMHTYD